MCCQCTAEVVAEGHLTRFEDSRRIAVMNNKNNIPTPSASLPLSTNLTARMITAELGEREAVWLRRLHNWRRPERSSPIPWQETEAGRPVYYFDDVRNFIDEQLKTRAATAPAGPGAAATKVTAAPDADGSSVFVRVLWNAGSAQGAFSVTAEAARALAGRLLHAASRADKAAQERML
jgi:hypothetical protein